MNQKILLKIGDEEEFNPANQIQGLEFLGIADESSSPQWTNTYQDVSGVDGAPFANQVYGTRTLTAKFWLHFATYEDFILAKHDVYRMFSERKVVRVRTNSSPDKVFFGYVTPFDIAPISPGMTDTNFSVAFDVPNGYMYSRLRSDAITDGYQFGMNILSEKLDYHFVNQTQFRVYNASDITINPYEQRHDLKIITKFGGSKIKLTNKTTSTEWAYNKPIGGSTLILNGINNYLDGKLANTNSDYGYLTLKPGWNEITVEGASSSDITFSFPFIYLL